MLDIKGLTSKAKNMAKQKATGFLGEQFPSMGVALDELEPKVKPEGSPYGWAGLLQQEALLKYRDLNKLGIQHKNLYAIRFHPYKDNATKNIALISQENLTWLATDLSIPLLQLDSDTKKVGHHSISHVTGSQSPELTLTFIESSNNDVMNSIRQLRNMMCRRDGTQALPSEYVFWIDICPFGRKQGREYMKSASRCLVYVSQATLDMAAAESDALLIPVTLTQARQFMPF